MAEEQTVRKITRSALTIALACAIFLAVPMAGVVTATHDSQPVAVVDGTFKVPSGNTVYLDGTFSSDPGGGALSFLWTFERLPEGSLAEIMDSTDAHARFDADLPGLYRVRLVVNNGFVDSEPALAIVVVTP